jgi:hypothetical protein
VAWRRGGLLERCAQKLHLHFFWLQSFGLPSEAMHVGLFGWEAAC